jgi:ectoine hydroxylase-related dioxygenase (phytanoyl-CoA dioxygenase family)
VPKRSLNLDADGFGWDSLPLEQTAELMTVCDEIFNQNSRKLGIRNAVGLSSSLNDLVDLYILPIAKHHLGSPAFLVRSTLFDKPIESNWAVPWHQDVTIEVQEQIEVEGFGPWSVKDGLISVQPPESVLENMLTLRLHVDDTDDENGALIVDPGSHRLGKLRINDIVPKNPTVCSCEAGDILLMRPLLFHASNRSVSAKPRRVLHLDFALEPLPSPLKWRSKFPHSNEKIRL